MKMGFDGGIKLDFHGAKATSDGGLLAYRELDERSRVEPLRTFVRPGRARAGLTPPGRGFQSRCRSSVILWSRLSSASTAGYCPWS